MTHDEEDDKTTYLVVVNHEEQYSIWRDDREIPDGWREAGKAESKAECLDHIATVWADMRPLSLRRKMEEDAAAEAERNPTTDESASSATGTSVEAEESLVSRLARGNHAVVVSTRSQPSVVWLKEAIDRGYVLVKFTDTRGGTELGIHLDTGATDLSRADFERGTGRARIVGELTLDYMRVRCITDIELPGLTGTGHLEIVR
jgi:uncharacterized protein YbdZ (MbtH family)